MDHPGGIEPRECPEAQETAVYTKAMFQTIHQFYQSSLFSDLHVFCQDFQSPIRCHKIVLSAMGSFFNNVLTDDTESIHLPDFEQNSLQSFIDSLYALLCAENPSLDTCNPELVEFFGISLDGIDASEDGLEVKAEPDIHDSEDNAPLSSTRRGARKRRTPAASQKAPKLAKQNKSASKLQVVDKNGKVDDLSASFLNDLFPEEHYAANEDDTDWMPEPKPSRRTKKEKSVNEFDDEDYDPTSTVLDDFEEPSDIDEEDDDGVKIGKILDAPLTAAEEKEVRRLEKNKTFFFKHKNKKLVDVDDMISCVKKKQGMLNINVTTPTIRTNSRYSKIEELTTLKSSFQALMGIKLEYGVVVGKPLAWSSPETEDEFMTQFEDTRQAFRDTYGICDGELLSSRVIMRMQDFGSKKRDQFNNMSDLQKILMNKCTREDLQAMLEEHEIVEAFKTPSPTQAHVELPYDNWVMHITDDVQDYHELVVLGVYNHAVEVRKLDVVEDTPANISTFLMKVLSLIWTGGLKSTKFPHNKYVTDTHFRMARVAYKKRTAEKLLASNEPLPRPLPTFTCEICGKTITENAHFTKRSMHMRDHKAEMFQCDCGIDFKNPKEKRNHYYVVHAKWKVEQCPHCSMLGSTKAVAKHIATYHKGFMCDICGKVLPNSFRLFSHKKMVHENAQCKDCGMAFVGASKLYYHIRTKHQERVLYRCDQCTVACSTQQALKTHWKRAHGSDQDRPFKCRECGKAFVEKPKLKYHLMNTHIRSRPFVCRYDNCKSDFNDLCNLYAHEKKVHGKVKGQAPSINEFVTDEKMYEMGIIADHVSNQVALIAKEEKQQLECIPEGFELQ